MVVPTSAASSSGSHWKAPSAAHQAKFNLVQLPNDFEPTEEENELLEMYEKVRQLEKEAARIKEQAAKAKLVAADAKYKQQVGENSLSNSNSNNNVDNSNKDGQTGVMTKKKSRRKKHKKRDETSHADTNDDVDASQYEEDDEEDDNNDDDDGIGDYDTGEDEDPQTLQERRENRLAEMRKEIDQAKQSAASEEAAEEALRAKLLETKEEEDIGPALKRKRVEASDAKSSSLIANLNAVDTPPHDFSKKLGLKSWEGKLLFPVDKETSKWEPPEGSSHPNEGSLILELADFDVAQASKGEGNNTIAIKFMAPSESKRFSINIASPNHGDFLSALFHFNPRQHERGGQAVVNDKKEGIWGQGINLPMSQLPLIFGQTSVTLIVQINGDGFDVYLQDQHCCRLEHRTPLPAKNGPLFLQFPSTDDYGSLENWSIYKVWWGHKSSMTGGNLSEVKGVNAFNSLHPKKLFISGLSRIFTQPEVDLRRAELERAFRKFGGDQGVIATVPTNVTFAFVEVETERQADLALADMQNMYKMNRARRSRYEALQEERAEAEALTQGGPKKESTEWD